MLLQKVELFHVKMPITEPWITSYGYQDAIESVFVHLDFDVSDGWGNVLQRQYHHTTVNMRLARLISRILF